MRHLRIAALAATLLMLAACATNPPSQEPAASSQPAPTPVPTQVVEPSATAAMSQDPAAIAPELTCPEQTSMIIDYAPGALGHPDILASTQGLRGVRPSDVVVVAGTSTVVIRDGQAIWRGEWSPVAGGFILGGSTACKGAGIDF
jgi:hypothetical protein